MHLVPGHNFRLIQFTSSNWLHSIKNFNKILKNREKAIIYTKNYFKILKV